MTHLKFIHLLVAIILIDNTHTLKHAHIHIQREKKNKKKISKGVLYITVP